MPAYDSSFNPPAPVTIVHPVSGAKSVPLQGKLDTGADVTVIPEQLVTQLGLTPKGNLWTRGYDGTYSQRPVYYVGMTIEGFLVASGALHLYCAWQCATWAQRAQSLLDHA